MLIVKIFTRIKEVVERK